MGESWGWGGHQHHDGRLSFGLLDTTGTKSRTTSSCHHEGRSDNSTYGFSSQMARNGCGEGNKIKDSPLVFTSLHQGQEERQVTSGDRLVRTESLSENSNVQNGNRISHLQSHLRNPLGDIGGHRGRLLPCPNELGLPQIPGLQTERENICFPVPPVWTISSSLGVLQDHQTNQTEASHSTDLRLLFPRRLHNFCEVPNICKRDNKNCSGSPPISGIQNKLDKILLNSFSKRGVSGSHVGPQELSPLCASGQTTEHNRQMSRVSSQKLCISGRTGELDGRIELRSLLHRLGKTTPHSHHDVGKPELPISVKRFSGSSGHHIQKPPKDLVKSGLPQSSCSDASCQTDSNPDDRCLSRRMVWDSTSPQDIRQLGPFCSITIHELEGIEGCSAVIDGVQNPLVRESCPTALGQLHDGSLPQTSGLSETQSPPLTDGRNSTVLQGMEHQSPSSSHQGSFECTGGSRFTSTSNRHGVVSGPDHLCMADYTGASSSGGPVCDQRKYSTSPVHLSLPRPSGGGLRRVQHVLEPLDFHIPDASTKLSGSGSVTPTGLSGVRDSSSSILAVEGLVSPSLSQMSEGVPSTSKEFHPVSNDNTRSGDSQRHTILEPSRLDSVSGPLIELGLVVDGVELVSKAHRETTNNQYQGVWKRFLDYLVEKNISHRDVTKVVVMNFLAHQYTSRNLAYTTIAGYKSALASPLELTYNIKLDDTPLYLLMRGVFNSTPPKPAPMALWSLDHLLAYLSSDIFEPENDGVSLYLLTRKVLCLTLLATGRRIDEVAHLSQHVTWENGGSLVRLHWLPNYVPKHYNKDFRPPMPAMECMSSDSSSET